MNTINVANPKGEWPSRLGLIGEFMDERRPLPQQTGELTLRGLLLGAGIIVLFMAANVYMGLKTGMTFASSIPAAMISMGLLRLLGNPSLLENNIVQTQASAAGTLCNVILVLPGLVLIGHWQDFPFWQTTAICLLGGLLGVAYSIPLRRTMVLESPLPFPEGTAAAEVLRAGESGRQATSLRDLLSASSLAAIVGLATSGFKLLAASIDGTLSVGPMVFRFGTGFSLALVGLGYLVGIGACLALMTGVVIAWGIAVPALTAMGYGVGLPPGEAAQTVWSEQVRLIGAGIIAVGGVWTIVTLARPIFSSVRSALKLARTTSSGAGMRALPREERDLPITWVAGAAAALTLPLAALFAWFAVDTARDGLQLGLIAAASLFAVLFGFMMAAVCGYLAGLLGSSSSPISGIGILATMVVAVLMTLLVGRADDPTGNRFIIAMALLVTSVIVTIASIANDNLQDLKTGQLVGATPWRQQVALIVGVTVGAVLIGPLLNLLYRAYGFVGAMPHEDMDASAALPAPQAALIAQIAGGIVQGTLHWNMVMIGMGLGLALVALEARLRRRGITFPALTLGVGMYLPLDVEVTIFIGGVLGWLSHRSLRGKVRNQADDRSAAQTQRRGVLIASGFLVGESFVGVLLAAADTITGRGASLALVGPDFASLANSFGVIVFAIILVIFYRLVSRPRLV